MAYIYYSFSKAKKIYLEWCKMSADHIQIIKNYMLYISKLEAGGWTERPQAIIPDPQANAYPLCFPFKSKVFVIPQHSVLSIELGAFSSPANWYLPPGHWPEFISVLQIFLFRSGLYLRKKLYFAIFSYLFTFAINPGRVPQKPSGVSPQEIPSSW